MKDKDKLSAGIGNNAEKAGGKNKRADAQKLPVGIVHGSGNVNASNAGLEELIEKNIKWSQLIYDQNRKIKRRITIMLVGSYLKLVIIIIPLIVAAIYLPPLLKQFFAQYNKILGGPGPAEVLESGGISLDNILGQISSEQMGDILKMLK